MNPQEAKKQFPEIWEKSCNYIIRGWLGWDGGNSDDAALMFVECTEQELDIDMDKLAAALEVDAWKGMNTEERAIYNHKDKMDSDADAFAHGEF